MDLDELYRQHSRTVYRYLMSLSGDCHLAEELTQETMFRAVMNIGSFRGESGVSVWLCQIAKHLWYETRRKRRRTVPLEEAVLAEAAEDPAEALGDRETAEQLLRQLHALEEPYKEVFLLHALGDVPLRDISRLFGKSDSWARVTYYRAKARIARRWKEENDGKAGV